MYIDFLFDVFGEHQECDAVIWHDQAYSYGWMSAEVKRWSRRLTDEKVPAGSVVSLEADFSPTAIALMLALIEHGCVIVPLTSTVEAKKPEFRQVAEVGIVIEVGTDDQAQLET